MYIIYEGPSLLDGKPIVAIVTGIDKKSKNSKTGSMPQVWILRSDTHPIEALRSGEDKSICGDCIYRPQETGENALKKSSRKCYVNVMSFNGIYKAYKNNKYNIISPKDLGIKLEGYNVRIGAYGDPAAVPIDIWDNLLEHCKSTGYTHQWRTCDVAYAKYCMASCDSSVDVVLAKAKGYRSFWVQSSEFSDIKKTVDNDNNQTIRFAYCPASKEKKLMTCNTCMACSGTRTITKANITIKIH